MKKKILAADDSPLMHQIYKSKLTEAGYTPILAKDGLEAISLAITEMPDMVITDVNMPKINGYQVCRLLKDHLATKHIPILIATTDASANFVEDPRNWSFQTGADAYLDKSEIDTLLEVIHPFLNRKIEAPQEKKSCRPLTESEILQALSALLDKQLYLDIKRLKELGERQNIFVANVSHEFRSPLSIFHGYLEMMQKEILGTLTAQQKKAVDTMLQTTQRLTRLVADLLDVSKIELGQLKLVKEQVDLGKLVEEVVETCQVAAKSKGVSLIYEHPQTTLSLVADRDHLIQVIINILHNSIKFTPEKGKVIIRSKKEKSAIRIEIEDSGLGISKENLSKIFDKFTRVASQKKEGTGLGLAIAKDIVLLHHGKIWAESDGKTGSKFIVTLPTAA